MTPAFTTRVFGAVPKRLLDLGCAGGATTGELAALGHWSVGLEYDGGLASLAMKHGAKVVRGDGRRLPFGDASFDGVVCLEVLEHVSMPELLVAEVARVLRPGGTFVVAVPTAYTEILYSRLHPGYSRNAHHVNVFRKAQLWRVLEGADLRPVDTHAAHLGPAIAWLLHALVRTEADHTGRVLEHQDVDRLIDGAIRRARGAPGFGYLLRGVERRVGKSRYVYARRN